MANESIPRRSLLARLGFAGAGMLVAARSASASGRETAGEPTQDPALHELDRWLTPLTAPSRQLIDIINPVGTSGFNYALTFLYANTEAYKRKDGDVNIVVALRDEAVVLALGDALWAQYRLGEAFAVMDAATKAPIERNPHARRGAEPPHLSAAIDALQARGVVVVACATAMRTYASQAARRVGGEPAQVRDAWVAGMLPGIVSVPAGIVAVNAAQRRGFAYAVAG